MTPRVSFPPWDALGNRSACRGGASSPGGDDTAVADPECDPAQRLARSVHAALLMRKYGYKFDFSAGLRA
ncbi:MAG TPA: hypothetical protein VGT08_05145 [Terracidiphilus sp.]|nr:hypothetical protein [Terracidiphilus sp.]